MLWILMLSKFVIATVVLGLLCWLRWSVEWCWMSGEGGLVVIIVYAVLHLLGTLFNIIILYVIGKSEEARHESERAN